MAVTKSLAVARTAWREIVRQPAIWIVTGLTLAMIVMFRYFTLFGLGEERSMIREMGLASITLAGLLVAVLGASTVLAEEEEKRTLLTLLAKPVRRGEIIVGKFLGIALAVLFVSVPLTLVYIGAACWAQVIPRGADVPPVGEQVRVFLVGGDAWQLVKASALAYAGVLVLAAVSIAISTRLPMMVNIIVTLAVFALGHQADSILVLLYPKSAEGVRLIGPVEQLGVFATLVKYPLVAFGKVLYGLVPGIEAFNAGQAVAVDALIPVSYVAAAFGYAVLYVTFALLIAVALFRGREFA